MSATNAEQQRVSPKQNQTIAQWYARKYIADSSEHEYFLELLNSTQIANAEKHSSDLHNQNDIITEIKTFQKKAKELNVFSNSAKQNRSRLKNENDCDRASTTFFMLAIQQEKDLQMASQLYRDFNYPEHKLESVIELTDMTGQTTAVDLNRLRESVRAFEEMIANRNKEIQTIDELVRTIDEKSKINDFNAKEILRVAKETKRLEDFGEEESEPKSERRSDRTIRSNK